MLNLIEEGRRVGVLPGEGEASGLAGHAGLLADVGDEVGEVQEGVGRGDEESRQGGQAGQGRRRGDAGDVAGSQVRPGAGSAVFGDPEEGQGQGGEDGRDGHLGGHGQSHQGAQQYAVAGASAVEKAEHRPQAGQGRQYGERLRAVKVGVLDVSDAKSGEGSGEDTRPSPVHTAADDVEQADGGNIGQSGEGASGEAQFHDAPIDEGFKEGAQQDQRVDEGAA